MKFDIKKDGRFDTTEMLLWNIWQELKEINKTEIIDVKVQEKPKSKCKKCGAEFENKGDFLAHSRKCKGDGKNV